MNPTEMRVRVGVVNALRVQPARLEHPIGLPWCVHCQMFHHMPQTEFENQCRPCAAPPPDDHQI